MQDEINLFHEESCYSPELLLVEQKELQHGVNHFRLVVQEPVKPLALYALASPLSAYHLVELTGLYLARERISLSRISTPLPDATLPLRDLSLWASSPPAFWRRLQAEHLLTGQAFGATLECEHPSPGWVVSLVLLGLVFRPKSEALYPISLPLTGALVTPPSSEAKDALTLGAAEQELFGKGEK